MIKNDRQLKVSYEQKSRLSAALQKLNARKLDGAAQIQIAAVEADLRTIEEQIKRYEAAKQGRYGFDTIKHLSRAGEDLVLARVSSGLSQAQLAKQLGKKEQQVQRYESTCYKSASLETIRHVADVLLLLARP